jgi:hypothetical protein
LPNDFGKISRFYGHLKDQLGYRHATLFELLCLVEHIPLTEIYVVALGSVIDGKFPRLTYVHLSDSLCLDTIEVSISDDESSDEECYYHNMWCAVVRLPRKRR